MELWDKIKSIFFREKLMLKEGNVSNNEKRGEFISEVKNIKSNVFGYLKWTSC